jgi:hypothetical protein
MVSVCKDIATKEGTFVSNIQYILDLENKTIYRQRDVQHHDTDHSNCHHLKSLLILSFHMHVQKFSSTDVKVWKNNTYGHIACVIDTYN